MKRSLRAILVLLSGIGVAWSEAPAATSAPRATELPAVSHAESGTADAPPRGLRTNRAGANDGYVMFSPILSDTTYLVDNDGRVVHLWKTAYSPGGGDYLLANGNLLRTARDPDALGFRAGGVGGILQELDWEGHVVWEWKLSTDKVVLHHDIEPLPNGHILALAWEIKTHAEATQVGRRSEAISESGLWPDWIVEIEPQPPDGARIVWTWHVWDHLVQSEDPALPNYGSSADHPHRLDINASGSVVPIDPGQLAQLQALGYVPVDAEPPDGAPADDPDDEISRDFLHINAIDYNPALDQIALSVPTLSEIWILDHSTTPAEAASSAGGRAGQGGDLLYRWGNPSAYGRGGPEQKQFFYQHDVRWIPDGWQGAGRLTIFNNGDGRRDGSYSSVDELEPAVDESGRYPLAAGAPFGPSDLAHRYTDRERFFSPFISGAQRLANGNTLICQGTSGRLFEISPQGEVVWEYWVPFGGSVRNRDGSMPQPGLDESPNAVFRATRIPADHPALAGRTLEPIDPQPPVHVAGSEEKIGG